MMKENLTELVFILDKSGSMSPLVDDTIGGFNSLLKKQKNEKGQCVVTTVLFNQSIQILHNRIPIEDVKNMTEKECQPMGSTIDKIKNDHVNTPKEKRPDKVLFAIITDGAENSSTEYKKGTDEYNSITQMAVTERDPDGEAAGPEAGSELKAPMDIDFASLKSVNDDVVGWIYVEAVPDINYPIVHGKDNETYLHRTYEKNYNFAGTIFVDYENKGDFSDCNTIVYGHNMKNGSMFAQLKKFTQDEETYKKSKYFWIFTPEKNYRYEIISAYTTGVNSDTYTLFKGPGEEFEKYLEKIRGYSEIRTDAEGMNIKDKIITLSTCTGNEATRYVVQGKRVDTLDVGQ